MDNKPELLYPVVVEGKYDKIRLLSVFRGTVLTTDGFRVFNDREKAAFFKALSKKTKIILLTDSDGAGMIIRRFFRDSIDKNALIELYTPQIKGKERRKSKPSSNGYLGVEGQDRDLLLSLLSPFTAGADASPEKSDPIGRVDLYLWGLDGGEGSREKRRRLLLRLGLPAELSTSSLLQAINLLYSKEEIASVLAQIGL